MSEEYLTDDEQMERAKQLAREYGPWTVGAIVIGLLLAYGWRHYQSHQEQNALNAAARFDALSSAVQTNDGAKARPIAEGIIKDYPRSPYADQARLTLARLSIDEGQNAAAVGPLTEVMEHSADAELKHIARLRLARVQIDQGKPDDALRTLAAPTGAFDATYHDVRGDAYYAKHDLAKAREEYRAALAEDAAAGGMSASLLALKIADLGLPEKPTTASISSPNPVISGSSPAPQTATPPKTSSESSKKANP